jgi:hypothetical protein
VDGEGGVLITGTDATGLVDGAGAAVVGCTTGSGAAIFARSTTGKGAGTDAIGAVGGVSVPAPSNAGLTRKGTSGSAAADPAASSNIGNRAGLSCPRREDDMPNRCVGATLEASH